MKGSLPFSLFQFQKQINIYEAFHNIVLAGGEGDYRWIQNTTVSSKAFALVNFLNTFVHDCWSKKTE